MTNRIRVSDHALVRFLERAGVFDVGALRAAIEDSLQRAHKAARSLGDSDYLIRMDGLTFVVRGDSVTTLFEGEPPHRRARILAHEGTPTE